MAKNQNQKTSSPIGCPAVGAANDLRASLGFNDGASTRNALSAADRAALAGIRASAQRFAQALRSPSLWDEDSINYAERDILPAVERYIAVTEGTSTVRVAGHELEVPAIESDGVRAKLHREGEQLLSALAEFIEQRTREEQRKGETHLQQFAALEAAMRVPQIAAAVAFWASLRTAREAEFASSAVRRMIGSVEDEIRTLFAVYASRFAPHRVNGTDLRKTLDAWLAQTVKAAA